MVNWSSWRWGRVNTWSRETLTDPHMIVFLSSVARLWYFNSRPCSWWSKYVLLSLFFRAMQSSCVLWWLMGFTSCTKLSMDPARKSWWRGPTLLSWISTLVSTAWFEELIMGMAGWMLGLLRLTDMSLSRNLSLRDVLQLHRGRSVHRPRRASIIRRPSIRCRQSVHHPGGRRCFPDRAG